jgi:signal transduction histidine kinase/ActR/RegA family two-component response regulator
MDEKKWSRYLARERTARKEAESLLESKSRELWDLHEELAKANEVLEQRVEERTRELAAAKEAAEAASHAKSAFLANMSHELRTPMNGVIGAASLLALSEMDEDQQRLIDTVDHSATDLLKLLNEILDLSKIEAGKLTFDPRPFDVISCVSGVVELLRSKVDEQGIELTVNLAPGLNLSRIADETRLRQVLLNLVGNAVKFTKEGSVSVHVSGDDEFLEIAVKDTGIGIHPERLTSVFEEFVQADASTTREHGGSGLGLAISKRLIDMMGGELHAESILGQGSTFHFRMPSVTTGIAQDVVTQTLPSMRRVRAGGRVLLAEDHPINQAIAKRMLEHAGCEVTVAEDGVEALEQFRAGTWDVVLLDWQMPRMSGIEGATEMRAYEAEHSLERTPLVAMTANAMPGDRETCLAAGMDGYLSKPVRFEDLVAALVRWIPAEPGVC